MGFINSKKYDGVQLYHKTNKDISYYIRYKDENNKLRRVKIGDKSKGITENYCYAKRAEILNKIRLGEEPPSIVKKKRKKVVTLNQVAEIYFQRREAHNKDNAKTRIKYNNKLKKEFGENDIDTITTDKLIKYQAKLKKEGIAPSTINFTITFIGTLFNDAIDEELYFKTNPVRSRKLKKLKVDNNRERYLATEEIKELYKNIDDENVELFVRLALSNGGRLETILNIQKKDINLVNSNIKLKDLKNDSTYFGFIPKELKEYLEPYLLKLKANDYVVGGKATKYATRTIQRKMKNIFDPLFNIDLDTKDSKNRVVIHTLRHTFASHLAINSTPIYTIQKLMNHKDIDQTMRYAKLDPNSGKDFVNDLYR